MTQPSRLELLRQHFLTKTPMDAEELPVGKSSQIFRDQTDDGNKKMKAKRWHEAMSLYNMALLSAPTDEELSIAYSNRSSALLRLQQFALALESIALAKGLTKSEELLKKLEDRERKCQRGLDKCPEPKRAEPVIKLTYPAKPGTPFINDLKLVTNDQFGRHVITERPLRPADMIAIEETYVQSDSLVCSLCPAPLLCTVVPCPNCAYGLFSGPTCLAEHMDCGHSIECPILPYFKKYDPEDDCLQALRIMVKAVRLFPSVVDLKKFVVGAKKKSAHNSGLSFVANKTERQRFLTVYNLQTNENLMTPEEKIKYLEMTGFVCRMLKTRTTFGAQMETTKSENIILDLYYHLLMIVRTQPMHRISEFGAMLNHSCSPNVEVAQRGRISVFVVVKPVAPKEQLFMAYDLTFNDVELVERREYLQKRYKFLCVCEACTKKYAKEEPLSRSEANAMMRKSERLTMAQIQHLTLDAWLIYGAEYPCMEITRATFELLIKTVYVEC